MLENKIDLIEYRINRAKKTIKEIDTHLELEYYHTAANRLYYSCFYAISALLLKDDLMVKTHKGIRNQFGLKYINTGLISKQLGDYFNEIFEYRQTGDYDDLIDIDKETILKLYEPAKRLIDEIEKLINLEK
jgi:uncharacterized protein (UPF0332 family)